MTTPAFALACASEIKTLRCASRFKGPSAHVSLQVRKTACALLRVAFNGEDGLRASMSAISFGSERADDHF
jgi:hypothetical protein